jgi:hypothetical protein
MRRVSFFSILITAIVLGPDAIGAESRPEVLAAESYTDVIWGVASWVVRRGGETKNEAQRGDLIRVEAELIPGKWIPERRLQFVRNRRVGPNRWYGCDCPVPRLVYNRITIELDGKKVSIPAAAFVDMGDSSFPPRLEISTIPRGLLLKFSGGDAAGSYNIKFFIENGRLVRRIAATGEMPQPFESQF